MHSAMSRRPGTHGPDCARRLSEPAPHHLDPDGKRFFVGDRVLCTRHDLGAGGVLKFARRLTAVMVQAASEFVIKSKAVLITPVHEIRQQIAQQILAVDTCLALKGSQDALRQLTARQVALHRVQRHCSD
ncbi:MAG: hypothetical protein DWH80_00025 [Planctomycetota bacterium]|nr:MAG: hypothetical protein DWH80_00025 [Planctomycetota bacterium]